MAVIVRVIVIILNRLKPRLTGRLTVSFIRISIGVISSVISKSDFTVIDIVKLTPPPVVTCIVAMHLVVLFIRGSKTILANRGARFRSPVALLIVFIKTLDTIVMFRADSSKIFSYS